MRIPAALLTAALIAAPAFAKLPPPSEEAKAAAAEAAAKSAWADKIGLYQLCLAQDRVVAVYRNNAKAAGTALPAPAAAPPCTNPGPYVSQVTPATSKPLEASGAHSPPGAATSPPSTKATAAEIAGSKKK